VPTQLTHSYGIAAHVMIDGHTLTPTQTVNVNYSKPLHELLQFGFVTS
jgi:hypothetical protein